MSLLGDVGRLLEAASHALAAANETHMDGMTDGPAAMPPVCGPTATGYVTGSRDEEGLHVGRVVPVDRVDADHVDPAGGPAPKPSARSAAMLVNGLVLPPTPPLLSLIPTLGTPLLVSDTTPVPQSDRAQEPTSSLDTIAAAAARLFAAVSMIAAARASGNTNTVSAAPFTVATNMRVAAYLVATAAPKVATGSALTPAAGLDTPVNLLTPASTVAQAVPKVAVACTDTPSSNTVAAAKTTGRVSTGSPARPKVAATSTVSAVNKDTPAASTASGIGTGAPAAEEVFIAVTGSPESSTDAPAPPKVSTAITLAPASTLSAAVSAAAATFTAPSATNTAATCRVAAAGTVAALGTGAAVSTGAFSTRVSTATNVCVADDTVVAASTVGAVYRPASEASAGSSVVSAASTGSVVAICAGAARDPHGAEDASDAMDVVAPLAAEKANPGDPATPFHRSSLTGARDSIRLGTLSVPSGGTSASERRAASRIDKDNANASNQLHVRAAYSTPVFYTIGLYLSFTYCCNCTGRGGCLCISCKY